MFLIISSIIFCKYFQKKIKIFLIKTFSFFLGEVHHQHVVGGHTTHIREVEVATDLGHRRYVEEVDILIVDQGMFYHFL